MLDYRLKIGLVPDVRDLPDFDAAEATEMCASTNGDEIVGCVQAVDAGGELLGYVVTVTDPNGYGGNVTFSIGVTLDGVLNGYSFTEINETAGLGMKAKEEKFSSQFAGKSVESFVVTKTGSTADNEIDAITGSTITSKAMANGCNAAICYFQNGGLSEVSANE